MPEEELGRSHFGGINEDLSRSLVKGLVRVGLNGLSLVVSTCDSVKEWAFLNEIRHIQTIVKGTICDANIV
jgi:hypothetical protein